MLGLTESTLQTISITVKKHVYLVSNEHAGEVISD